MEAEDYPALFRSADEAADRNQKLFLRLIRTEYALLVLVAFLIMPEFDGPTMALIYAIIFLALIAVLVARALLKPDQAWYRCRAFAESVKTLAWRYSMVAEPFEHDIGQNNARAIFRKHLQELFDDNHETARRFAAQFAADQQITNRMNQVRQLSLRDRREFYSDRRVQDQRIWYAGKAQTNRLSSKKWVVLGIAAYAAALILVLCRIRFTNWHWWPVEPVIVFAASIIGWTQIKKFSELAAAYTVTAHEIGILAPRIEEADSDERFSEFVNDAERAFSREHTMWIARQTH